MPDPKLDDVWKPGYFLREQRTLTAHEWMYRREFLAAESRLRKVNDWDYRTRSFADRVWMGGVECSTVAAWTIGMVGLGMFMMQGEWMKAAVSVLVGDVFYLGVRAAQAFMTHYNRRATWQSLQELKHSSVQEEKHNHIVNNWYDIKHKGIDKLILDPDAPCGRCTQEAYYDNTAPAYIVQPSTTLFEKYALKAVPFAEAPDPEDAA